MTKILVADDEQSLRDLLVDILTDAGYDVVEAKNGGEAYDKACGEMPDLVVLDVAMPMMDGFEVLRKLRENPDTEDLPVVMLTVLPGPKGELPAWQLGARHYITKPFDPDRVELTVKIALREAADYEEPEPEPEPSLTWQASAAEQGGVPEPEDSRLVSTGSQPLNQIMGGGIPLGTLTLVEGTPSSGKTVLSQHIAYEALQDGHSVAYFTSENTPKGIVKQMESLGFKVAKDRRSDKLHIEPLEDPSFDEGCDLREDPEGMLGAFARQMENLPEQYRLIFADAITSLATATDDRAILRFFVSCKRMSKDGRAIILVGHSYAFDEGLARRVRDLCDAHFSLQLDDFGGKTGSTLEVTRVRNSELHTGNSITFEVQPGTGIQTLAFAKVRV